MIYTRGAHRGPVLVSHRVARVRLDLIPDIRLLPLIPATLISTSLSFPIHIFRTAFISTACLCPAFHGMFVFDVKRFAQKRISELKNREGKDTKETKSNEKERRKEVMKSG